MNVDDTGAFEPRRVPLTDAATDALEEFAQDMRNAAHDTSGPMAGSIGKARGHCLRLACILAFLHWTGEATGREPMEITDGFVAKAAALMELYFLPMAERTFGDAAIPIAERRAMSLARYLRKNALASFNARDVRRALGGDLREAANMEAACALLTDAAIIRPAFVRTGATPGRKAKTFDVNPAVLEAGR